MRFHVQNLIRCSSELEVMIEKLIGKQSLQGVKEHTSAIPRCWIKPEVYYNKNSFLGLVPE